MLRSNWLTPFFGMMLAIVCGGHAWAQGTIKVAYTDPLSGPFAQVGDANLKQMQYIIDYINAKGGALGKKFELVPFDNKSQPSDALIALKSATDQNMPFIMQCSGSNIAAALIDFFCAAASAHQSDQHEYDKGAYRQREEYPGSHSSGFLSIVVRRAKCLGICDWPRVV